MFKRILVPLDGSRFGSRALPYAIDVAKKFKAEIIFTQVVEPVTPAPVSTGIDPGMSSPASAEMALQAAQEEEKRETTRAKRYLRGKVRAAISDGVNASYRVIVGDPAQSIMGTADKENVNLVIMTTHGKSGLKRAIMGSVADKVIRESGKPVLVIRPHTDSNK
jgi:nucleotide-binding universal stress UspA family protein